LYCRLLCSFMWVVGGLGSYVGNSSVVDPDPDHFVNLDPHVDPHPHQIKIGIRIRIK
jgi:hypothetical protein